jgi:hypothetical protein
MVSVLCLLAYYSLHYISTVIFFCVWIDRVSAYWVFLKKDVSRVGYEPTLHGCGCGYHIRYDMGVVIRLF